MISIRPVRSQRDLKVFIRFPEALYRDHPFWVPPLETMERDVLVPERNPSQRHARSILFLAEKDGRLAGRVAGIIHDLEVRETGHRIARFGWLDMIDDPEVTRALLGAVESWARKEGMEGLKGPLGFTHLDKAGMLIHGFDLLPTMVTIYNHPYYARHMEQLGYRKDADWKEYRIRMPARVPERMADLGQALAGRYGYRLAEIRSRRDIRTYQDGVFAMVREAYRTLYDYVPIDQAESDALTAQFLRFLKPSFLSVVLDANDRVIGFGITAPSFSRALQRCGGRLFPFGWWPILRALRRNDTADLYLIGVADEYRNKGVNALIFGQIMTTFIDFGIRWVETNPELEDNHNVQALWRRYEPEHVRTRRAWIRRFDEDDGILR